MASIYVMEVGASYRVLRKIHRVKQYIVNPPNFLVYLRHAAI
jgi:hypothetical protein